MIIVKIIVVFIGLAILCLAILGQQFIQNRARKELQSRFESLDCEVWRIQKATILHSKRLDELEDRLQFTIETHYANYEPKTFCCKKCNKVWLECECKKNE